MRARNRVPVLFLLPGWVRTPVLSVGAAKELHELVPFGVVALAASLVGLLGLPQVLPPAAWVFYLAGEVAVVAMGAAAFGHEFSHRTLVLSLSQPVRRRELWWLKMQVLGAAMAVLFLLRLAGPVLHGNGWAFFGFAGLMSVTSLGYGLLVAPALTLWSRSTLAGTVFTLALPIVLWQAAALVACVPYGLENRDSPVVQGVATTWFVAGTVGAWLLGPILTYVAFTRLEATESRGVAIRLPRFFGGVAGTTVRSGGAALRSNATAVSGGRAETMEPGGRLVAVRRTKRRDWLALTGKELRLMAPAFVVAGLYLLIAGFDLVLRGLGHHGPAGTAGTSELLTAATMVYGVLVSLLVGSLACAEDRHAGTLQWHLVQPVAVWRQWAVKAVTALVLALVLAIGLPWLVIEVGGALGLLSPTGKVVPMGTGIAALQVLGLCTLALYISTLAPTALRAMLWAAPIGLTLETLGWGMLDRAPTRAGLWNWFVPFETEGRSLFSPAGAGWVLVWGGLLAGFFISALACACQNYRRLDQRASRVMRHGVVVVGYSVVALAACFSFKQVMGAVGGALPMRPETLAELQARICAENVSALGNAVGRWALAHQQQPPPDLGALVQELASPEPLVCPADPNRKAAGDWASWNPQQITYTYEPLPGPTQPFWTCEIGCPIHATKSVSGVVRLGHRLGPEGGSNSQPATTGPGARWLMRYGMNSKPSRESVATNAPSPVP